MSIFRFRVWNLASPCRRKLLLEFWYPILQPQVLCVPLWLVWDYELIGRISTAPWNFLYKWVGAMNSRYCAHNFVQGWIPTQASVMAREIRFGILGCANIARTLVKAMKLLPEVKIDLRRLHDGHRQLPSHASHSQPPLGSPWRVFHLPGQARPQSILRWPPHRRLRCYVPTTINQ